MLPDDPQRPSDSARASEQAGRRIRRLAMVLSIALVLGFLVVHFLRSTEAARVASAASASASAAPLVNVIVAEPAPALLELRLPGETAAWYESTLYARVDGYVGKWTADIGDTVKKGQVLATIETPDLDAQLAAARAKLQADEAQLAAAQAALSLAGVTYERWRDAPKGVVSEQERDSTKAGYDSAVAQVNSARAQRAVDQALADRYAVLSGFKQVTAPYDGKVTERKIDIGNLVTAGSTASTTLLYKVAQNDPMRVFVDVPQSAAADMKPGVAVSVRANHAPDRAFAGRIARTADAIDPHTRTLRVEVDLRNPQQLLVPGMYVDVDFRIPARGSVQVPAAALVFRSGGPQLAVLDQDQRVRFRAVEIVRDNGSSVEIGPGVKVGERIVLDISSRLAAGDRVEINAAAAGAATSGTQDAPAPGQ